ncbi:hypothetical protein FOLKNPGA_03609 [Legionella sp. PC1000]|uniref:hypothetical protein n=1 Tax=Legionella sp. PC1000 TaxID=2746060 RepID=UPI0015FDBFBB|nr:hypothetical protein [Legionella sp. PC1000]QLZ70790.1 hypothetical protein FOLKNPGA_03609 [Legionella sp. PC1000]
MSLLSRRFVSSSMFLVAAGCSMVSIYGLYIGEQLTMYDYISGAFSTVSNMLWLGASAYDIYLTCHQKHETRKGKGSSATESDEQSDDIEKQLNLREESSFSKYKPIIQKMKIKPPSLSRRHSSDNFLIDKDPSVAALHIKFKYQDKVHSVQIPEVFFKNKKTVSEDFNDVFEQSLKKKVN